jgi:orotidine-5'-phosphate decarboxylase
MTTERRVSAPRVIVALDTPSAADALALAGRLSPADCRLKVGYELFTAAGPDAVSSLIDRGFDVFLDLKYHDIPNTVAAACAYAARLGVWMMNVHALGGKRMMQAAREAIDRSPKRPLLIGVTILTSHSAEDLADLGLGGMPEEHVVRLADQAQQCGLDGVVCSAREAPVLRQRLDASFCLVTPGIRPAGSDSGDQRRVVTPVDAIQAGSDYLVIGRPITGAADPARLLMDINRELMALAGNDRNENSRVC